MLLGQRQLWDECSEFVIVVSGKGYTLLFPCFVRIIHFFWMFLPEMSDLDMPLHRSASVPVGYASKACKNPAHSGPVGAVCSLWPYHSITIYCFCELQAEKASGDLMWRKRRPENTEVWKEFKLLVSSICIALPQNIFFQQ